MSERITAANLDEVIKRNEVIEEQMKQSASLIWSKYNPMQINSPIQLALQILRPYGLIQLPIDNRYLSGAIFVRDGKRIPLINTALPRANQYFTVWHEIYHLLFDEVSFDHLIESEILMEERKAEHFAALMLLGNLMPYFEGLKDMEFQAKAFQCMNAFQAPYKAVLISLYESAVKNGNTAIAEEVKENFDVQVEDIAQRFRDLGLDDSLVRPSYVVNVSPLQEKINKTIRNEPEVEYHKDNQRFLQVLQIVFGKVVLVSSLAVDWPFGVGLRLYIEFAQAVDYDVGMDVACSVIAICMGADQSLMPRKISFCVFQPDGLCMFSC